MPRRSHSTVSAWIALSLSLMLTGATALAAAANGGAARLHAFLEGLVTLQAEFAQTTITAEHGNTVEAEGTFYLRRPGKFRWEYRKPADQLIVADGSRVWLYDPELEQVSHKNEEDALRGTPALVLSDTGPIDNHFSIRDLGERDGGQWVELRPKAEDSEVSRIALAFVGDHLDRVEMEDAFGQITRFRFSKLERNPTLDEGLFRFQAPSGIDVFRGD